MIEDLGFSKEEICLNLTINGRENRYARNIFNMARGNSLINFLGLQNKEEMNDLYSNCDLVVFPSYLETWGLPISEAKEYKKELMLADLPYAYEAIGEYNKCLLILAMPTSFLQKLSRHIEMKTSFIKQKVKIMIIHI